MQDGFQVRHLLHRKSAALLETLGQFGNGEVGGVLQSVEEFRTARVGVVVPGKYEVIVVIERPQTGVGGDGKQAEIDHQGREVVDMVVIVLWRPLGVLVVLVSQFRAAFAAKFGQEHPVIVHQPDIPVSLHHDVAMLQVVVGDAQPTQTGGRSAAPLGGDAPQGVRLVEPGADEFAQLLSSHPFHLDHGIPAAADADPAFQVLEVHKGWGEDVDQIVAQLVVASLLVAYLPGEAAHRKRVACDGYRIDASERAGEHQGHPPLVDLHFPGFKFGAFEAQPGILDSLAEIG